MKKYRALLFLPVLFLSLRCTAGYEQGLLPFTDIYPPVFISISTESEDTIRLVFDKASDFTALPEITPVLEIFHAEREDTAIILTLGKAMELGREYMLSGTVKDSSGNRLRFLAPFYGHNGRVPEILINEFNTQGSKNHPDLTEIIVISPGNLAGVSVKEGTPALFSSQIVFPALEVESGDFILVHWKPEGIPEEVNETKHKAESGGLDACPEAWDFWASGGSGLPGNNGVLTIYTSPTGTLIDAVIYSNRTSASDQNYMGFGTRDMMNKALALAEAGGWAFSGEDPKPEEAVNPTGSTATRSICRKTNLEDTDSASDWYIVPTGKASFGKINCEEVYSP